MNEETAPRWFALLDRDGTIVVDKVYLRDPSEIEFAPGAIEVLQLLRDVGFSLVLVTNQSGVARGLLDEATVDRIHARLRCLLAANGLRLEAIYYCPHGPENRCGCRKPEPEMLRSAMRDLGFGSHEAVLIGDRDADMEAVAAAGIRAVRLAQAGELGGEGAATDFREAARRACALISRIAQPRQEDDRARTSLELNAIRRVSDAIADCAHWLNERALPLWASSGFDERGGAFEEQLDFSGAPVTGVAAG